MGPSVQSPAPDVWLSLLMCQMHSLRQSLNLPPKCRAAMVSLIHFSDTACFNILSKFYYVFPQPGFELFISRKGLWNFVSHQALNMCQMTSSEGTGVFRHLSLLQNISDESGIPLNKGIRCSGTGRQSDWEVRALLVSNPRFSVNDNC